MALNLPVKSNLQPLGTTTPQGNTYKGRDVNIGRIQGQFSGGPALASGVGEGLQKFAGSLGKWYAVLEEQEQKKQTFEAMDQINQSRARQRKMLDQMGQMTGASGVAAPYLMEEFYKKEREQLEKSARGDFQKMIYSRFLDSEENRGLDKAMAHRTVELERWKDQTYQGFFDNTLMQAAAAPESYQSEADKAKVAWDELNPNVPDEFRQAKHRSIEQQVAESAIFSETERGRPDLARGLFDRAMGRDDAARVRGAELALPTDSHHHITSPFGQRTAPKTPNGPGSSNHQGIDLRMPVGTPVKAISGGTIEFAGDRGGYGVAVIIKHDDGTTTSQYGHLSTLNVKPGDRVSAGQVVALSGNTGKSTGPHLDLKVKKNGAYVDPAPLLGLTGQGLAGPVERQTGGLFDPQQAMAIQAKIRQAEAQQENLAKAAWLDDTYNKIQWAVNSQDPEDQDAMVREYLLQIEDQGAREELAKRWELDQKAQEKLQNARDMQMSRDLSNRITSGDLTPSQALSKIETMDVSDETRKKMISTVTAGNKKMTPARREAMNQLRRLIDTKDVIDDADIDAYAWEHGLTDKQVNDAIRYRDNGGNVGFVSATKISSVYKNLGLGKKVPNNLYDLVVENLEPGQKVTEGGLRKLITNLYMDGELDDNTGFYNTFFTRGLGGDMTYVAALSEGRGGDWLPDVSSEEREQIKPELERLGIPINDVTIRRYKKHQIMGIEDR